MQHKYRITVFTPTYNRAYIINQLFESLLRQTFTNFEWLVIDDGSTDNTEELISNWQKEKYPFPIRYVKQKNGGKCRAINHALDLAQGELFFTVDSDDYLTDDALEKIDKWFYAIQDNTMIKGIVANRGNSPTNTKNYIFPEEYRDLSLLDMYSLPSGSNTYGNGERAFVFYTYFHRDYKYPEFDNEMFMTEAIVWNRMAHDGYLMRFFNDIIWIYEYREDGLTKAGSNIFINNPHGFGLFLREKSQFMHETTQQKRRMVYTFTCDLSSKYRPKLISECIGAPLLQVKIYYYIHMLISLVR